MPTKVYKVLNQGTSNPIIARTTIQPSDLLSLYPISDESKGLLLGIYTELCKRLLEMEGFEKWLRAEYESIQSKFLANGLKHIGGDAFEIPQIIGLEPKTESFLQSAKLSIMDCGSLFKPLFGKNFDHRFHKVIRWAKLNSCLDDEFVTWLEGHNIWIMQVIEMRNALEHPKDGPRGRLHIKNLEFRFSEQGTTGNDPVWFLTGEEPSSINKDARTLIRNILRLSEEVLATSLIYMFPNIPISIVEIFPADRDAEGPIRFKIVPKGNFPGA